jgi:hypothetical protein
MVGRPGTTYSCSTAGIERQDGAIRLIDDDLGDRRGERRATDVGHLDRFAGGERRIRVEPLQQRRAGVKPLAQRLEDRRVTERRQRCLLHHVLRHRRVRTGRVGVGDGVGHERRRLVERDAGGRRRGLRSARVAAPAGIDLAGREVGAIEAHLKRERFELSGGQPHRISRKRRRQRQHEPES